MNLGTFSNVNAAILQVFVRWVFFLFCCFFVLVLFILSGKANMKDFHRMTFGHQDPDHLVLLIFKSFPPTL